MIHGCTMQQFSNIFSWDKQLKNEQAEEEYHHEVDKE